MSMDYRHVVGTRYPIFVANNVFSKLLGYKRGELGFVVTRYTVVTKYARILGWICIT